MPPFLLDQLPLVTYKYGEISYYYPEAGKILWLRLLLSALRPISPEWNGMPQYILWQLTSLDGLVFSLSTTATIIHTSYSPTNVLALGSTTHILFHMNFQRPNLSSGIQKQSWPKMIKIRGSLGVYLFREKHCLNCDYSQVASCYPVSASCHNEKILFWTWIISIQINQQTYFADSIFFLSDHAIIVPRLLSNHRIVR